MIVDIVIDTICPWCYVGKRRFSRALELSPQDDLRVGWRAFQLNPDMSEAGMERDLYTVCKFGSKDKARPLFQTLEEAGHKEGIEFHFNRINRIPNTLNSHRLIRFAAAFDLQTRVVEALFHAYFSVGRDIGDRAELAGIGESAGLDREEVLEFLESGRDSDKIVAEDDLARRLGINGVPSFIINRRYAISGAQAPEVIAKLFDLANRDALTASAE